MQVFRHYFICIATVKLLQFFNFISDQSVFNKLYSTAFLNWYQKNTLFMELSVSGKKQLKKFFLQVFRHYFICIATVNFFQFLTFSSDHSVFNNSYSNGFFKLIPECYYFHGIFRKW